MSQIFKKSAQYIRSSPFIIPITLIFVLTFVVSCTIFFEDYSTSRLGYLDLPTLKANVWISWFVALIPQLLQIALLYVFIEDTHKRWALLIAFFAHFVDVGTDVWYKVTNHRDIIQHFDVWLIAFIESELIYSFGSEGMFTLSFGMLIQLFPDFLAQIRKSFVSITGGFTSLLGALGVGDEDETPPTKPPAPSENPVYPTQSHPNKGQRGRPPGSRSNPPTPPPTIVPIRPLSPLPGEKEYVLKGEDSKPNFGAGGKR